MDFSLTEEQIMMRDTIRKFVETEIPREVAQEIDGKDEFPHDLLQKLCDLSGGAEFPIEVDVAADLPFRFLLDNLYKFFGILMLHTAFYFFQSHLPKVFNCACRTSESKN